MKKIFTLVAMATMALAANAQSQFANFKTAAATLDEATSVDPVVLATSANVKASFPFKDDENASKGYKAGHIKCDGEAYVVITDSEGKKYIVDGNGATGGGNPRTTADGKTSPSFEYPYTTPARGVVFQFEIDNDFAYTDYGTLVVVGKFGDNKNYLVHENGSAIPYTLVVASKDFESSQKNYVIDEDKIKGDAGVITGGVLGEGTTCKTIDDYYGLTATKKNGVGAIMFPVVKGRTYQVFAVGSKLCASGFVLLADDDPETIELIRTKTEGEGESATTVQDQSIFLVKDYLPTNGGYEAFVTTLAECEGGTAVAGIAEAKAEVAAPVKVITANGIQIGNYNIAGQQVK